MLCTSSNTTTSKQSLQSPKTASGGLKMTSEAAGTRPIVSASNVTPVCPKQGGVLYRGLFRTNTKMASGGLKMTSEASGTRSIIFNIKSYPCMPKAGSHSIQGMASHSGQTRKQTNKQIPLCFISIEIQVFKCFLCACVANDAIK